MNKPSATGFEKWYKEYSGDVDMKFTYSYEFTSFDIQKAFEAGRKSVLDKWPSRKELEEESMEWFGNQTHDDICTAGFKRCYYWLRERLKG